MSNRPSPLQSLLSGLGGSLPQASWTLLAMKREADANKAAAEETQRREAVKAAQAAMADRRDMSRAALLGADITPGQAMEADYVLGQSGYDIPKALDPVNHTQTETTSEGYPFQRTYSPDVVDQASRVAKTLGARQKPKESSSVFKETPIMQIAKSTWDDILQAKPMVGPVTEKDMTLYAAKFRTALIQRYRANNMTISNAELAKVVSAVTGIDVQP